MFSNVTIHLLQYLGRIINPWIKKESEECNTSHVS